jgi:hypothetical protein
VGMGRVFLVIQRLGRMSMVHKERVKSEKAVKNTRKQIRFKLKKNVYLIAFTCF